MSSANHHTHTRSLFSNKFGYILAAAASAIGLGNLWRFPYLAAKYGGGTFLITYIVLVLTLGFTLSITENSLGRKTGKSAILAFREFGKKYTFIGVLVSVIPMIIFPYYSVIGGWVLKYFATYARGGHASAIEDGFFGSFISSTAEPLIWTAIFLAFVFMVVAFGVNRGIEKSNRVMMPLLLVLLIAISIYGLFLPGAIDGLKYFLIPDFSKFSPALVLAAMGQMFYSLSLAMGILITYGSYLDKKEDLEKSVAQVDMLDTVVSILAGLMIIPAVFAVAGPENLGAGPSLMFITLPKVFNHMGAPDLVGSAFFLLVFFAAATSAISLLETIVSIFCDATKMSRKKALAIIACISVALAVPSSLGYGIWANFKILGMQVLDFMDFISNSLLMPIAAFLTCVFVGWIIGAKAIHDEITLSSRFKTQKTYRIMVKYVAPILVLLILASSMLSAFGLLSL
ncbi:MAG: sodium-dependent transporter [Eubacteriales bacterium]|nr:sodium-dependent transporter [Eubacteriales bacterium]